MVLFKKTRSYQPSKHINSCIRLNATVEMKVHVNVYFGLNYQIVAYVV